MCLGCVFIVRFPFNMTGQEALTRLLADEASDNLCYRVKFTFKMVPKSCFMKA